jgi:hypothetical protein
MPEGDEKIPTLVNAGRTAPVDFLQAEEIMNDERSTLTRRFFQSYCTLDGAYSKSVKGANFQAAILNCEIRPMNPSKTVN